MYTPPTSLPTSKGSSLQSPPSSCALGYHFTLSESPRRTPLSKTSTYLQPLLALTEWAARSSPFLPCSSLSPLRGIMSTPSVSRVVIFPDCVCARGENSLQALSA